MNRKLLIGLAVAGLAFALGWLLAEPDPTPAGFADDDNIALPITRPQATAQEVAAHLDTLYRRAAWSAQLPERELSEEELAAQRAAEAGALPEGLDRFRLLGIIRVAGAPPEALLHNLNPKPDERRVFRASAGDDLLGSGIILERIESQTVFLLQPEADGAHRQLPLFPRISTNGSDP